MAAEGTANTFYPKDRKAWRRWLEQHHDKETSVWIIQYKKNAARPSLSWSEAVDEALCFGWIDSTRRSVDEEQYIQFFCRRKPDSNWSRINKDKIASLKEQGLLHPAGAAAVERAKENGAWTRLDAVEDLTIPKDLDTAFRKHPGAKTFFLSLSKSLRKQMLQWITLAKRPETRAKRITEVAGLAAQHRKPKQF